MAQIKSVPNYFFIFNRLRFARTKQIGFLKRLYVVNNNYMILDEKFNFHNFYGKFNCVIYFEDTLKRFSTVYTKIVNEYCPLRIDASMFDLESQLMLDFDYKSAFSDDNIVRRIIFGKEKESVILDYYRGKYIVEYLCYIGGGDDLSSNLMCNFLKERTQFVLVLGFELSVSVNEFYPSLERTIQDQGTFPIVVVVQNESGRKVNAYIGADDEVDERVKFISDYLQINLKISE
jgi:hypothetical protein